MGKVKIGEILAVRAREIMNGLNPYAEFRSWESESMVEPLAINVIPREEVWHQIYFFTKNGKVHAHIDEYEKPPYGSDNLSTWVCTGRDQVVRIPLNDPDLMIKFDREFTSSLKKVGW
jgi:hypothetical protein